MRLNNSKTSLVSYRHSSPEIRNEGLSFIEIDHCADVMLKKIVQQRVILTTLLLHTGISCLYGSDRRKKVYLR